MTGKPRDRTKKPWLGTFDVKKMSAHTRAVSSLPRCPSSTACERGMLYATKNFISYVLCMCVCAVCYRFFMSYVTGIKECTIALLFESAARLYALRNGLIVFSLFRACVKACSSFNLSRVKFINEIIECNPSFFFRFTRQQLANGTRSGVSYNNLLPFFLEETYNRRIYCNYEAF